MVNHYTQLFCNVGFKMCIELIRASKKDAPLIWDMQVASFKDLYEKYEDNEISPALEKIDRTIERIKQASSFYYIIKWNNEVVGAIRVIDKKRRFWKRIKDYKVISPIFILPQYRNKGIAQEVFKKIEEIHGTTHWKLTTILEEKRNCHLYEKLDYKRFGEEVKVNDKMTLIDYKKE